MLRVGEILRFSASDLVGHVDCHHLTTLDVAVARGQLEKPKPYDPLLQILAERGLAHERQYVDHLRQAGFTVVEIEGSGGIDQARVDKTLEAMRAGAAIIVQGAFIHDGWSGRTDILKRVELPSALGAWSYEVIDTKLARRTKGATLLQLSLYSELLSHAQGRAPEYMHVVKPGSGFEPESFRTAAFASVLPLGQSRLCPVLDRTRPSTRPIRNPTNIATFAPGESRVRHVAGQTTTCAWSPGSPSFRSAN